MQFWEWPRSMLPRIDALGNQPGTGYLRVPAQIMEKLRVRSSEDALADRAETGLGERTRDECESTTAASISGRGMGVFRHIDARLGG